jgi:ethanolamine ammonia-lyase large subunit
VSATRELIAGLRRTLGEDAPLGKRPAPEFDAWLNEMGIMDGLRPGKRFGDPSVLK